MACVGRPSVTIQRPRAGAVQWRPMKAAWFDALIFDPHFGGQNCLSVICCASLAGAVGQSDGHAAEPAYSNKCLLASMFD